MPAQYPCIATPRGCEKNQRSITHQISHEEASLQQISPGKNIRALIFLLFTIYYLSFTISK